MDKYKSIILIGYSGHAYVVYDIFKSQQQKVIGYCDQREVDKNPFHLTYFGSEREEETLNIIRKNDYFIAIGNNKIRKAVFEKLIQNKLRNPVIAIHKSAVIESEVILGAGTMIGSNSSVNALAKIGRGVICNTGSIIEHECIIGDFAHIAPGAVLTGNVEVGAGTFVGANSVVKQGIKIGKNVTIGAGSVVIKDVPDNVTIVGNPAKIIKHYDDQK